MPEPSIITRFAPSPTGYLHIGAARTALFNWLYARKNRGKFLLRIEDTDKLRSTPEAVEAIFNGLNWLGLSWDEEPVFQSKRIYRHTEVVQKLLEIGAAYKCYTTPEELSVLRETAYREGRALRSPWRDTDYQKKNTSGIEKPYTVRIKVPEQKNIQIQDTLQGDIFWKNKDIDDFVLLRTDGTPTYMLSVVVDDKDMHISHIIRGDDHLVNAARQSLLYQALDWKMPVLTHIPLIHGSDGKKLSKRHGALGIEYYKGLGLLPEGLCNYLMKLGWSSSNKELFTREEAIKSFDLKGLTKAPSRLDMDKAKSINRFHLHHYEDTKLIELLYSYFLEIYGETPSQEEVSRLKKAIPFLKLRTNTLEDLAKQSFFLVQKPPIPLNSKLEKLFDLETRKRLSRIKDILKKQTDWSASTLLILLKNFIKTENIGFGKLGKPLRVLLTGSMPAPDLADIMSWFGQEEVIRRIEVKAEL